MSEIIDLVALRKPAPQARLADGSVVQVRYFDAAGWQLLGRYEQNPTLDLLFDVVMRAVPELSREAIDSRCTIEDCVNLIHCAKGNASLIQAALKNGQSDGENPAPSPTPPSATTTTSPALSAA